MRLVASPLFAAWATIAATMRLLLLASPLFAAWATIGAATSDRVSGGSSTTATESAVPTRVPTTVTTAVTPAPCAGSNTSMCPHYWHRANDTFYEVYVNGLQSFVYQGENPPECSGGYKAQPGHCARLWNVQSQSYTMASADYSMNGSGVPVEIRVVTSHGRLAGRPFTDARVVAGFGKGEPTTKSSRAGEFVFTVASAGHYSVELFGQGEGLRDALLLFLDDRPATASACPSPTGGGKLHHFAGPSASNSGYYAFDMLTVAAGDVVCLERGAWVEGHLSQDPGPGPEAGCSGHGIQVAGGGVWSGQAGLVGKTPAVDRRPLIQLCGANISVTGIVVVNALAANVELSPYWYTGYHDFPPGQMRALRGGNRIHDVKALSTWWYSTDGLYAGPWGEISNSFVMVNDDALKPMARHSSVTNCTVWQGDNGWSIMLGWNTGTLETGMSVRDVHVIHVGHWADAYCYPCNATQQSCGSGSSAGVGPGRGYCDNNVEGINNVEGVGYGGYRAVIGAIYGEPGGIAGVTMNNIRVSGAVWRAFSIAATWSEFGQDPVGNIHNWVLGPDQPIVFEQPQKQGIRSKLWGTGLGGLQAPGAVFDMAFWGLVIANVSVSSANYEQYFALAQECTPASSMGKNVINITFGGELLPPRINNVAAIPPQRLSGPGGGGGAT